MNGRIRIIVMLGLYVGGIGIGTHAIGAPIANDSITPDVTSLKCESSIGLSALTDTVINKARSIGRNKDIIYNGTVPQLGVVSEATTRTIAGLYLLMQKVFCTSIGHLIRMREH